MIYHVCSIFFFLKHFRISIGLNLCWSPVLEALLEMKKKNTKDTIKCLQYYVIMIVIDKFQPLNLFIYFENGLSSVQLIGNRRVQIQSLKGRVGLFFQPYIVLT